MIDKPAGITSHDVVARVRRAFKIRAVGHTGTLDPFASGLLVVVLGSATRLARFVEAERKTYLATVRLGWATATDDRTGAPLGPEYLAERGWPSDAGVRDAVAGFIGRHPQRPPAFSAKHVEGERSYAKARRGEAVELAPVPVTVFGLEVVAYRPPVVELRAEVGPGTYIRAIARDLGERLGTGAHLEELRRVAVGPHRVEDAVPLGALSADQPCLPPLALVGGMPRVALNDDEARRARHGQAVGESVAPDLAALVDDGGLIAVAEGRDGRWQPVTVLAE